MKKIIFLSVVAVILTNCKNKETEEVTISETPITETVEAKQIALANDCYVYDADGSKIELQITNTQNEISGNLCYTLKEKDSNKGTFKGNLNGAILVADYTFQSEGTESTRQVAFLVKDNQLIEGYGETITEGNISKFKDITALSFTSTMPLTKTTCEK